MYKEQYLNSLTVQWYTELYFIISVLYNLEVTAYFAVTFI